MSESSDKELVASSSVSSQLADPRALAGLATGLACALALTTALIAFCCIKASRRRNMKNLEEAPQHEMAAHVAGNCQGGTESWEVNYVPYSGADSPFTIGEVKRCNKGGGVGNHGGAKSCEVNYVPNSSSEVLGSRRGRSDDIKLSNQTNTATDQEGVEKWRNSYVPFSPPSSFPWKTVEDESSSKGYDGNGGDRGEVDVRDTGTSICPPSVLGREKPSLKQRVRGLQQARYANRLVMATDSSVANLTWDSSHEPLETRESSLCLVHTPKPKCLPSAFSFPDSSPESPLISGSKTSLTWDDNGHSTSPV